jgi:O-antigen ligase
VAAIAAFVVTAILFARFVQLERRGRSVTVVYLVLATILVETAIYPDPNTVPNGIFHPSLGSGSTNVRLQDLVIPAALLARLLVRGAPRRLSLPAALWAALFAWLGLAAFVGLYSGNSSSLVLFEAKAIVYLGAFALTLGVPTEELLERHLFDRLIHAAAAIAAVVTVTQEAHLSITKNIPLVPLAGLGEVGSDGASLYATLGVFALVVGMTRERGRLPLMLSAIPLFASVAAAGQRAAMVDLVVALAVLAAAAAVRRRFRTTPTEIGLIVLGLVAILIVPVVVRGATSTKAASLPFENTISVALTSTGKKESAQSRVNQLDAVRTLIKEQPVFGWGLGKQYSFYDPGPAMFVNTNLTHNIVTDLLLRTGAFGLLLFFASITATVAAGLGVWRRSANDAIAAVALAATAGILGLFAKGLVESIFEKYRLAALLGLLVGVTLGAAARVFGEAAAPMRVRVGVPAFAFAGVAAPAAGHILEPMVERREIEAGGGARRGPVDRDMGLRRRETALRAQAAQLDERARALQRERELWDAELAARRRELDALAIVVDRLEPLLGIAPDPAPSRAVDPARERELDERERRLDSLKAELERAAAELAQARQQLDERAARVVERERELLARAARMPADAAGAPSPGAPSPAVPSPAVPSPVVASPVSGSTFNVNTLDRLVEAERARNPERVDEWSAYLQELAAHADAQGNLPPRFDALVSEVFGELL